VGAQSLSDAAGAIETQLGSPPALPADRTAIEHAAEALRPLLGRTLQALGAGTSGG
jgi:hypothetical protein